MYKELDGGEDAGLFANTQSALVSSTTYSILFARKTFLFVLFHSSTHIRLITDLKSAKYLPHLEPRWLHLVQKVSLTSDVISAQHNRFQNHNPQSLFPK